MREPVGKNRVFFLTVVVVFLIFASLLAIFSQPARTPKYSAIHEDVEFLGTSRPPGEYLAEFSSRRAFIVSPEFPEGSAGQPMVDALTLFSVVLVGNNKKVVSLARVTGSSGQLLKCQTNRGDARTNEEISAEECSRMLDDASYARILISMPQKAERSQIILSENQAVVKPKSQEDTGRASMVLLKAMYNNSEDVISQINKALEALRKA